MQKNNIIKYMHILTQFFPWFAFGVIWSKNCIYQPFEIKWNHNTDHNFRTQENKSKIFECTGHILTELQWWRLLVYWVGNGPSRPLENLRTHLGTQDMFGTCPFYIPGHFCKNVCGLKVIWGHMSCPFIIRGHNLKLK